MSNGREVVIVSGVRLAIGGFGGSLSGLAPTETGAMVIKEALKRADIAPTDVGHVVIGHVVNTEPKDMYVSRVAAVGAGVPIETPAMNVNRLCGSGAQAIVSAAQAILLGECDVAVAGGAETMSRSPHSTQTIRTGQKMGDTKFTDMMIGALTDPFGAGHMGITAENVAAKHGIDRAAQDAFALESQRRAAVAIKEGRFKDQILPIEVKVGRDMKVFDTDEHPKATTAESLSGLKPAFKKDGSVTAGNASGINDGAAAVVLMERSAAEKAGKKPMARLVGYAHAGVEPSIMGIGPVPAVQKLMEKTGLKITDFDVIESNEAFAAQACAVAQELGMPADKVNPNGGAIALGHPIGATGAIITVKCMYELARTGGRYGLVTMCIGGGQGIALAIERM